MADFKAEYPYTDAELEELADKVHLPGLSDVSDDFAVARRLLDAGYRKAAVDPDDQTKWRAAVRAGGVTVIHPPGEPSWSLDVSHRLDSGENFRFAEHVAELLNKAEARESAPKRLSEVEVFSILRNALPRLTPVADLVVVARRIVDRLEEK